MYQWQSAGIDTGAEEIVIGLHKAEAYCEYNKTLFKPLQTSSSFRFSLDKGTTTEFILVRIPI